jgi:hypothetical protein
VRWEVAGVSPALFLIETSFVPSREQDDREHRTQPAQERVPLSVPDIPLAAKKCVRRCTERHGSRKFYELEDRRERHSPAEDHELSPRAAVDDSLPDQQLSNEDRGKETQREVTETIVVIALGVQELLHPFTERNELVRVGAAVDQNHGVKKHGDLEQRRQADLFDAGDRDEYGADGNPGDLEPPRESIVGGNARQNQKDDRDGEQGVSHADILVKESGSVLYPCPDLSRFLARLHRHRARGGDDAVPGRSRCSTTGQSRCCR